MRRISVFLAAVALLQPLQARAQTTPDTITTSFTVDGIQVILRRNTSSNVVVANAYLLGGTRQVTRADAGIEPFLLTVSEHGTLHYPKEVLRRKTSQIGSDFVIAATDDWTMFGTRTITTMLDSAWAIFADRLMNPTLAPSEVELVRSQIVAGVQQEDDDPDANVARLADSIAFMGHPYALPVNGDAKSLASITAAQLRSYQQTQITKSRLLLVVVGDVSRAHVESLVHATLSKLPAGSYVWSLPPAAPTAAPASVLVERSLPTNYILGYFAGPLASSSDYTALRVVTTVLTGEMFAEIRSRQNLTYDVHAPFIERAASAGGLYVTTTSPDTTIKLMQYFVNQLKGSVVTDDGLRRLELQFITQYFLDNETNASQADFLARSQLYQGDYRKVDAFVANLRSVTPAAIQDATRRYIRNIRWAYVGDTTKVDRNLLNHFASEP